MPRKAAPFRVYKKKSHSSEGWYVNYRDEEGNRLPELSLQKMKKELGKKEKTKKKQENLKDAETRKFVSNAFRDGAIKENGTEINSILPPVSRFGGQRDKKKMNVLERLKAFFNKYFGLGIYEV